MPMVDFIIYDPKTMNNFGFYQVIQANKNKPMFLSVYNLISRESRQVRVIPSCRWGGDSLLGADVRFEPYKVNHFK